MVQGDRDDGEERRAPAWREGAPEFVLDPEADGFAALDGRPNSLTTVLADSRARRDEGAAVRWRVPLHPTLVHRLEGVFSLALDEGIEPILFPAAGAGDLSPEDRQFAWDFIHYRLLGEERARLAPDQVEAYEALARELAGPEPPIHETPGLADMAEVLRDGLRGLLRWLLAGGAARAAPTERIDSALLIGAYGGEHIGDLAILGGVLRRIRARYATSRVVLMSQRPDHTRHLLAMLELPVELRVEPYEHGRIRACLAEADGLVYAGGPLTDIPKHLVRHLYAASLARRAGKPFVMEGIGVGPFPRAPSEWVGRRIAGLAERIAVRTSEDGRQPQVQALAPEVGRDPAFDYLESRGETLTRLPEVDRRAIAQLLEGSEGRLLVGVNTRPIAAIWTEGTPEGLDREAHTDGIEDRFERELAAGLRRFSESAATRPCFVFYPMNAIQFGKSDLRSAYRIARHLHGEVDFRVWQGDASLDGVVSLLRRLDLAIAMRFHGAIFALSQQKPVIGVDYRPGRRDKVGYLLSDFGQAESCTRIDTLTGGWLADRLQALAAARRG